MLFQEDAVFGEFAATAATDKNPRITFQQMTEALHEDTTAYPQIYMACGEQDGLLTINQNLRDFLRQGGAEVTWRQEPGNHNWDFWRVQLRQILD